MLKSKKVSGQDRYEFYWIERAATCRRPRGGQVGNFVKGISYLRNFYKV